MEGPSVGLAVTGSASIPARELDLRGTASLLSSTAGGAGAAVPAFELPFKVQGPWDDPIMLPDPQIRMERSGAAQPLLDAVRNRDSREAIRSAIERLTGAIPARPAAPPAPDDAPALAGTSAPAASPPDIPQSTR